MKSPRYWALQHSPDNVKQKLNIGRNEKPEILGIATLHHSLHRNHHHCRNEKPETLGIATRLGKRNLHPLSVEMKSPI